ncbi:MAG: amino acid permease [Gammaproteobacteria bacterium]
MLNLLKNRTFGSIFMIAGATIGAGMLALPLQTAAGGFYPSIGLFIICFVFMMYTVFLLLESNLMSTDPQANIISMTGERLGRPGQIVAWITFSLLLYSVSAAYMSAGGSLITTLLQHEISKSTPMAVGMFLFAGVFGFLVYFGTHVYDHVNKILMVCLIVSFFILVARMTPHVDTETFTSGHPLLLLSAVPVVVLSFTSHVIVPSLRGYLNSNVSALKKALFYGMLIPLFFYICWEFLILSLVPPNGPAGLLAISAGDHPLAALTNVLQENLGLRFLAIVIGVFSFSALVTSFIAVNVGLRDFLADGLSISKKTARGNAMLSVLTLVPPLVYALLFPRGFTIAVGYAGVFAAILYGILPSLMVYKGRYIQKIAAPYRTPGGKFALLLVIIFSLIVIALQIRGAI